MTQIHPTAVVSKKAQLADDVVIGPNCVVYDNVVIGQGTLLETNVVIDKNVIIGKNNRFYANCVIGSKPQMLKLASGDPVGNVIIGDNNTFHEQVTVHPSVTPGNSTVIGNENFLMVGVHIAHDCVVEDKIVMSNYVQIGGHGKIETGVWMSGLAASHQFVTFGKWCYVAGLAGVNRDIPPFLIVSGHYPPRIRGVNERGLGRAGMDEQQKKNICDAYQRLYRQGGALLENANALEKEEGLDPNVISIIESIKNSSLHRFGRYREQFRNH